MGLSLWFCCYWICLLLLDAFVCMHLIDSFVEIVLTLDWKGTFYIRLPNTWTFSVSSSHGFEVLCRIYWKPWYCGWYLPSVWCYIKYPEAQVTFVIAVLFSYAALLWTSESVDNVNPFNGFPVKNAEMYAKKPITYDSLKVYGTVWFSILILHYTLSIVWGSGIARFYGMKLVAKYFLLQTFNSEGLS